MIDERTAKRMLMLLHTLGLDRSETLYRKVWEIAK